MGILDSINSGAFSMVNQMVSPGLNFIMKYWAESFYIILPLIALYLYLKKDKNLIPYAVAVVVMFAISEIIKDIVKEPRPCSLQDYSWINHIGCESGYGFPSGHATTLTGLFFFMKNYKYVRTAYIIWLIVTLFGRIYLGQHYFTDVAAGVVIGLVGSYLLYRYEDLINGVAKKLCGPIIKVLGVNAGDS